MCGHQRSFRIYNYDKSDDDLKQVLVLGLDGPIYATEREVKQCWLFYTVGQSTVMLDTYKSHETYEYDKVMIQDLFPPKKKNKFKFIPFVYTPEPMISQNYREFLLNHRICREELSDREDLNMLFALDKIKERSGDVRFNVFDFLQERSTDHSNAVAENYIRKCLARLDLKLRLNTMRLNFAVDTPLFDECFKYNHLVYRTDNFTKSHKLTDKMLKCGYLCLRVKLEDVNDLGKFTGWGLHLLDPQENGLGLDFLKEEIMRAIKGNETRKLTALTRIAPEKEPLLFEDDDLLALVKCIEDAGLECSFKQEEEYDVRKIMLPNEIEVALVVKHIHYTKYSSIAFMSRYSDIMLKFICSGCESFYM